MSGYASAALPVSFLTPTEQSSSYSQPAEGESTFQSSENVVGCHIHAVDGEIGSVKDVLVDDESWMIRYLVVVGMRDWVPGRNVLVPPPWIDKIIWADKQAYVDLSREQVKHSPVYNPLDPMNREDERWLYEYYGRPKYWKNSGETS
jgi:hypothetical protein